MALNDDSRGSIFGNRNDDNSNLSSSFDLFSKSLASNADALKGNTKGLESSSSSLDKNTVALLEMAKSFKESVGNFSDSVEDLNENTDKSEKKRKESIHQSLSNMQNIYERSNKNLDKSLTRGQKLGKSFITTFEVLGKRLIGEFASAAGKVASKYKEQLSNITVRMQMPNSDYSDMFNTMSARFQSEGLNKQFSPVDYADALAATIETGLRGDEAQRQAYNNLITNKLVPAISTNTIAYRKMSKQFQDSFDKNVVAVSKYTEALYGAEGLEEGKANAIYETLESRLRYEESAGNIDKGGVEKILNQIQFAVSKMEAAGINTDQFISDIGSILEGNTAEATTLMQRYFGVVDTDQFAKKLSADAFGFVEDYMRSYNAGSVTLATANEQWSALGGNLTTGMQTTTALNNYEKEGKDFFGELRDEFSQFNSSAEYAKWAQKLQQGFGQSADAVIDKVEENLATGYGVFKSQIPRFEELTSDVKSILGVLISTFLFTKTSKVPSGRSSSGPGLLNKGLGSLSTFGGGGSLTGNANAAAELFNEGYSFSEVARVGGKGSAVLGKIGSFGGANTLGGGLVNLAAGPGALLVAAGLMARDAVQAGKVASDEGLGAKGVALQSLRGLFTGGQMMTGEEELNATSSALFGQKRSLDLGELGKNTLKYTALGAGVGTAVGGWAAGAGTAIGAGAGAIIGAITNLIDQVAENAKYNELADASNKMTGQFDKLSKAQSDYEKTITKGKENSKKVDALYSFAAHKTTKVTEDLEKSFRELQTEYPSIIGDLESINELEPQYIDALRAKIDAENKLAQDKVVSEGTAALESLKGFQKEFDDIAKKSVGKDLVSTGARHFLETIMSAGGKNGKQYSHEELSKLINESLAMNPGMTLSELQSELNAGGGGKVLKIKDDGTYVLAGQKGGGLTIGDNMSQRYNEILKAEGYQKDAIDVLNLSKGKASEVYSAILQVARPYADEKGNYTFDERTKTSLSNLIDEFNSYIKSYNDTARSYKLSGLKLSEDDYPDITKIFSAAGKNSRSFAAFSGGGGRFKVGAYNIYQDDYPALLHKGEMVLTSANAEKLRNLGSGGVSGLLDALTAITSARVSTVDSTSNSASLGNAVITAIQSQTESIVSVLNSILTVVSKINPIASRENPAVLSENLLNFSGV